MIGSFRRTYKIGGHNEKANIEVVHVLCDLLDELRSDRLGSIQSYRDLITFVVDRSGYDLRNAIDVSKIQKDLSWVPEEIFETGIRKTVEWYLSNMQWYQHVQNGSYQREQLGIGVDT